MRCGCGRVIRAGPPSRDGGTGVERGQFAELGVEAQRGHRGIELIGDEHQRQRRVKGEVTRARARAHHRIAFLYMAQRSTLEIEMVHEHAVGAEVCGEGEAVGGIGKDAVGMRSFTRVLYHTRGGRECAIRLDRQQRDVAAGVVGDEQGAPAPVHAHVAGRAAPDGCSFRRVSAPVPLSIAKATSAPFSSSFTA